MTELSIQGDLELDMDQFKLSTGPFDFPLQGVTVLFGRSGSGKSTLLCAIAGLDKRTRGVLQVGDVFWQAGKKSVKTAQRDIGFVFQDAALFPHMTVRENLLYGIKRLPKTLSPMDFDYLVDTVGIRDKLDRAVTFLSGGERQRVAIARALLMRPKLLCMDEPLSALDWQSKAEMLALLENLIAHYGIPVLYITHVPAEVERLADRVVFMAKGKIESVESLQEALKRADSPLFDEQGAVSVIQATSLPAEQGLYPVQLGQDRLWLSEPSLSGQELVRVRVLARDVSLALSDPQALSIINHLKVTIVEMIPQGAHRLLVRLRLKDDQNLFCEVTQHSADRLNLKPGLAVFALIKSVAVTN
ncbi:Sulfate/thiosulfate import ATP-binding protein CysA [Hydrogenovibrio crunogenus]|uniref:Sulfate/thiosulfate import ATP-binding protein CysA n=1 Tax=Hydrogenovibrio crunogenus TaxID=39765 RepID=A0A4P7P280_9GAMM|nr:molybdenum ABC transporter ATP-binding protein [Hydrogenovibrio crunogenus]QBZ83965.1 Sulfate/thiosulfate import ATP-binding protein CysA [Hydrogenovibrio crunogenus]